MSLTTRKMSDRHEQHLAAVLDGRMTRNSGAVWHDQMDGKHAVDSGAYVFAWDGKATLGKSISISREMWRKAKEQAHNRLPMLPLRFYSDERLTSVEADLVVLDLDTFAEMLELANQMAEINAKSQRQRRLHLLQ